MLRLIDVAIARGARTLYRNVSLIAPPGRAHRPGRRQRQRQVVAVRGHPRRTVDRRRRPGGAAAVAHRPRRAGHRRRRPSPRSTTCWPATPRSRPRARNWLPPTRQHDDLRLAHAVRVPRRTERGRDHRRSPGGAARPRVRGVRRDAPGDGVLRRLAQPAGARPRAAAAGRPAAARRAHQPPRPRLRRVAGVVAEAAAGHRARDLARPRVPRPHRADHLARRRRHDPPLRRQLQRVRNRVLRAAAPAGRRGATVRAHGGPPAEVRRPLPRAGHQGAAGAEPAEDARTADRPSSRRAQSASGASSFPSR